MKTFEIYIKSHAEAPDFEQTVEANSQAEAVEKFYEMLQGEFDRNYISENIREDLDITLENKLREEI